MRFHDNLSALVGMPVSTATHGYSYGETLATPLILRRQVLEEEEVRES